jgi:hypothetical protein
LIRRLHSECIVFKLELGPLLGESGEAGLAPQIPYSIVTRSAHLPVRYPIRVCQAPGC